MLEDNKLIHFYVSLCVVMYGAMILKKFISVESNVRKEDNYVVPEESKEQNGQ